MLHAEAKLARHQATAANNCKKSAALDGPARAAPMAQQKLATNWNAKESCSLFWLGICCRLSQFGKQATVEPWLIVWYSGFSGVVGVGKGQEGEYQGGQSLDNTNERGHDKLTSGICVQNEVSFSAEH